MRAQYAIEAMLIAAVFFVLISLFAGLYLSLADAERSAIEKIRLRSSLDSIASRADLAHFLGDGNAFRAEMPANSTLAYSDGSLSLFRNGQNASKKVFAKVVLSGPEKGLMVINRNGTVFVEEE